MSWVGRIIKLALLAAVILYGMYGWKVFNAMSSNAYNTQADVVVVLTGGQDRIAQGFELLIDGVAPYLYISGSHPDTVGLAMIEALPETRRKDLLACCITLDSRAQNTKENARDTAAWLNQTGRSSIILVTSSYHMPRAMLEFEHSVPQVVIYPHGVVASSFGLDDLPSWQILIKEGAKYWVIWAEYTLKGLFA